MKKKLITLCIVLMLAMSTVFAAVFQLGPAASLPLPLDFEEPENMAEPFKSIGNYKFGADLRATIPFNNIIGLGFGFPTMMSFGGNEYTAALDITPTVDLVLGPNAFVNLQLGLGYEALLGWEKDGSFFHSFEEAILKEMPVSYHVGIGFDLKIFGLNLSYYLPGTTISDWTPALEEGRLVCAFYLLNF